MSPKLSPADYFRSRPAGSQQWLDTFGSSMSPFLSSGDGLLIERGAQLVAGDIAVLARADGALIAHLVTAKSPLRTSSLLGAEDPDGLEPLGRAVKVRTRGVEVPVNTALRTSLLASHSVLKVGRARQAVHRVLSTSGVRALRRHVLNPEVRALHRDEERLAMMALGDFGAPFGPDTLRVAFGRGAVFGACSRGKVLALAVLVPHADPRFAQLSITQVGASARGLDLEARLVALAIVEARARGVVRLEATSCAWACLPALAAAGFQHEEPGQPLTLTLAPH